MAHTELYISAFIYCIIKRLTISGRIRLYRHIYMIISTGKKIVEYLSGFRLNRLVDDPGKAYRVQSDANA